MSTDISNVAVQNATPITEGDKTFFRVVGHTTTHTVLAGNNDELVKIELLSGVSTGDLIIVEVAPATEGDENTKVYTAVSVEALVVTGTTRAAGCNRAPLQENLYK